jgi:pimeloyl-ACP methyl ester carboxylesterase
MTPGHFLALALLSPDYSLLDDIQLIRGISFSGKALEKEIYADNLLKSAPQLEVPVYFLEGRYDTVLSPTLLQHYFAVLRAPAGKHLIWFDKTDHWLFLESRERYRAALRQILRETRSPRPS